MAKAQDAAEETPTPTSSLDGLGGLMDAVGNDVAGEAQDDVRDEAEETTPAAKVAEVETAEQPADPQANWNKPLQKAQQDIASLDRKMDALLEAKQEQGGRLTQEQQQQAAQIRDRLADARAKLAKAKTTIDPLEDTEAELANQRSATTDLLDEVEQLRNENRQLQQRMDRAEQTTTRTNAKDFWSDFETTAGIPAAEGQKLYNEELKRFENRGFTGEKLTLAASSAWETRVDILKQQRAAAGKPEAEAAPQTAPAREIRPGAARITPQGGNKQPPPRRLNTEEKLVRGDFRLRDLV